MAYDRGDYHFDDAGNWEKACRHIALFFYWASERGLVDRELHPKPKAIAKDPVKYFIDQCDTKLWDEDFSEEGNGVAEAIYDKYLKEVVAYARKLGVGEHPRPERTERGADGRHQRPRGGRSGADERLEGLVEVGATRQRLGTGGKRREGIGSPGHALGHGLS